MRPAAVLALLAATALTAGCNTNKERYAYTRAFDLPRDQVVKATLDTLEADDWRLEKADLEKGEFESKWKELMHHFRYEGYRTKAFAKVEKEEKATGYRVGVMVKKERNDAMEDPSNPDTADWAPVGFDEDKERVLTYAILSKLEPLGIGDDYDRRMKEREEMFKEVETYFAGKEKNPGTVRPPETQPRPVREEGSQVP